MPASTGMSAANRGNVIRKRLSHLNRIRSERQGFPFRTGCGRRPTWSGRPPAAARDRCPRVFRTLSTGTGLGVLTLSTVFSTGGGWIRHILLDRRALPRLTSPTLRPSLGHHPQGEGGKGGSGEGFARFRRHARRLLGEAAHCMNANAVGWPSLLRGSGGVVHRGSAPVDPRPFISP